MRVLMLFCLLSTSVFAELVSVATFQEIKDREIDFKFLNQVKFNHLDNVEVKAIKIALAPLQIKQVLQMKFMGQVKELKGYRVSELKEIKFIEFQVGETLENLKKQKLMTNTDTGFFGVKLEFAHEVQKDKNCDYYQDRIDELIPLTERDLYTRNKSNNKSKLIRSWSTKDLAQYVCEDAIVQLTDLMEYDGSWPDYDLRKLATLELEEVFKKFSKLHGEIKTAKYMDELYRQLTQWHSRDLVLKIILEFETAAGLFFTIKNHVYSGDIDLATNMEKRKDLDKYLTLYREQILNSVVFAENPPSFSVDKVLNFLSLAPVPGYFAGVYHHLNTNERYAAARVLDPMFEQLDLTKEVSGFFKEFQEIILEKYNPNRPWHLRGYSHDYLIRKAAVLALIEMKTQQAHKVLQLALKNLHLEDVFRELIEGSL